MQPSRDDFCLLEFIPLFHVRDIFVLESVQRLIKFDFGMPPTSQITNTEHGGGCTKPRLPDTDDIRRSPCPWLIHVHPPKIAEAMDI